jgi:hypothetical protein
MALRLGGLSDVDPLAVPLPPGTEVTTRVDRALGDYVVGQGAMGRVAALVPSADGSADSVEVDIVGVGRVRYLRSEVVPRKTGLVRYARRRQDAWDLLSPCIVVDAVVGSRAWGLSDQGSDTDRRGVFVLPLPWQAGLVDPPLDLSSLDGSHAYWEIGKAIRQGLRADPNTLEMLFAADGTSVRDELGAWLLEIRDAFVSAEIYGSFGRYALSQLERLEHNQRLADHRGLVLEWLAADPSLDLDAVAARLSTSAHVEAPTAADAHRRARDYIKQLYRSLYDQGHLATADWAALVAFAAGGGAELAPPRDLRPKNAYNLIRLLDLAIRWLSDGSAELRVRDAMRTTLLAIKRGEVPMTEVVAMARAMTPELEAARAQSRLPRHADIGRAEAVLRRARIEAARRFVEGRAGPWGADAPPPPDAQFDP